MPQPSQVMNTVVLCMGSGCFLVGVPTSAVLLWLIHHRTSKEMRPYARILTQAAVLDICLLLAFWLMNPVLVSDGRGVTVVYGVGVATADGTSSMPNRVWNNCLLSFYLIVADLATYMIPAQFYYRYAVVSRGAEVDGGRWVER